VKKLFLLMATLLVIAPSSFAQGSTTSKIAFVSYRDGNAEIYVMNPDGSDQTRITDHPASDVNPSWSPDGSRIAFTSNRDGNSEIYVMNADGSGLTRLTNDPAFDGSPTWSPDGRKIAFVSTRADVLELGPFSNIWVMNADGSEPTQLTIGNHFVEAPSWSPDGSKILFKVSGSYISVINADGSDGGVLKFVPGAHHPAWSPDGRQIVFEAFDPDNRIPNSEIYIMNADGSAVTRLTNNPAYEIGPSWSR
jgi:Tol biopolymer transport system component